MDINQIATKADISRLEVALDELKVQLNNLLGQRTMPPRYFSSRQVMELLNVKEWALRQMRISGAVKYVQFGRWRRYPTEQFSINFNNKKL